MNNTILLYICPIFIGSLGAWFISRYGHKAGVIDFPNHRSSHLIPTPKGGGIGIITGFVLLSLFLKIPVSFWLLPTLLAAFSFYGDRVNISPKIRLGVQFLAAFMFLFYTFSFFISGSGPLLTGSLILLAAVFIVGTANFYNFMDGIDGIAGIAGIVGFSLMAFFTCFSANDPILSTLAMGIALACIGFLPFNILKGRVFMGDVGSIFLGFVFAEYVILLSKNFKDFICLSSFLFPFYADELITMALRLKNRESLFTPHRTHLYQILANEGAVDHWKISVGYGLLQLMVGVTMLSVISHGTINVLGTGTLFFAGYAAAYFRLKKWASKANQ